MTTRRLRGALLAVTLLGCGGSSSAVKPSDPSSVDPAATPDPSAPPAASGDLESVLVNDTPVTTASKATFTAPAGWTLLRGERGITLTEPSGEAKLHFVEVPATDGQSVSDAAVAAAKAGWDKVAPGFSFVVAQTQELPPADGWTARAVVNYVVPTAESRAVQAFARRFGKTWYLALIDGKLGALDRRGAQVGATLESFRVPGMERESFAGKKAAELDAARLEKFAAFVEEARALTGVPGAAIAVVKGDQLLFERGFGVRELGKPAKVTPSTRFMIGSTTKSLTSLMMARLIDEKKLSWESPISQLAPSFALGDEAATKALLLSHTVCACTGMPRRDLEFIFEYAGITPEARMASMKAMKPSTGFGETFQYSNLMVAAGGYIAAQAALPAGKKAGYDAAYDAAMKAQVFGPLGMKATTLYTKPALAAEHAMPHGRPLSLKYEAIPMSYEGAVEAVRPAGAAWSTVRDLARYVSLELGQGTLDGKVIVSKENMLRRRTPQVKIDENSAYGLGLFLQSDRGVQVLHHGGNTLGFTSDLFVLPEHGLGVVVLSNAGGANNFRRAVRRRFLELLFDGKETAKSDMIAAETRAQRAVDETLALLKSPPDAAWLDALVGKYHNADLGNIEVRKQGAGYVFDVGEWKSPATQEVDLDKTSKVILTGAPFGGFDIVPVKDRDQQTFVLDSGQVKYVFAPVAAKAAPAARAPAKAKAP